FERELLVETYPGERYPVDNASAIGALALRARALGEAPSPIVAQWIETMQASWRDPASGLLVQSVGRNGDAIDAPRASGTAFAAYFLSFADESVARSLYASLEASVGDSVLGFGAMNEYPDGHG